ncbi:sorting nexin 2A [Cinnamomum micranthum f. kanehirae]|uniref:Sorting nexin 2A n=1 Tax=Cinnamomum micranthum f. kanehirae TaxID=337451 RepID=A0A443NRX6_9MAGN|nr:sorting nexin 2A [Cinnamomum micranthum f. kanehirae]
MGSENQQLLEEPHEEMENLALDGDDLSHAKSYSDYRSAMSSISESYHPLSSPRSSSPALNNNNNNTINNNSSSSSGYSDPLLSSSPSYRDLRKNPSVSDHAFLDPPSYADVIFSPFDEAAAAAAANGGSDGHDDAIDAGSESESFSSSAAEFLKISVSSPLKEQENSSNSLVPGGNTYVTYLIETRTNMPEFGAAAFGVRRRF